MRPQYSELPELLSQRIALLRARRGWTQAELAERLAASHVAVSHFEMGLALPSERTIVLLTGVFKLEPHELIAGTSYPMPKAERLPSVACRYTEVELQLALLQRDLGWLARVTDEALRRRVVAEWQAKLAALSESVYDEDERVMLAEAQKALP